MKQFVHTLLRFSIVPVLVLLLLETVIALQKKKLFTEQRLDKVFAGSAAPYNWVQKIKKDKVLLLGSSSVKYGLSCDALNKLAGDSLAFINLADEARDPVETYFILKQLDLSGVKAVYFAMDPWIFARNYYRNRNPYLYLDMDLRTAIKYSRQYDVRLFPNRYRSLLAGWLPASSPAINSTVPAGFGSASLTKRPVNFNDPVYKKFQVDKYGWSQLQFVFLQKIVLLCRRRNISFTAFYLPKRADFVTNYNQQCKEIHAAFLNNLQAAGFTSPITGSFDQLQPYGDSLFADAYHLNAEGQKLYSKLFWEMVNK